MSISNFKESREMRNGHIFAGVYGEKKKGGGGSTLTLQ